MTSQAPVLAEHGNAYNIFTLVLTLFSLAIMGLLVLPLDPETLHLLRLYDNVICIIFLADFAYNLTRARPRSAYFIGQRGWLDLLGSIPSLGFLPFAGLLRLARLSRLARVAKLLSGKNRAAIVTDVLQNRGEYAAFITLMSAGLVLTIASLLVLEFETNDPDANIRSGGDAIWWGLVTLTTVGYGDRFPVTQLGRLTGILVMFAGVGIIGALASILASVLVPPPKEAEPEAGAVGGLAEGASEPAAATPAIAGPAADAIIDELARLRAEIADLREALSVERT
jgi:voltage-gated potassium channel